MKTKFLQCLIFLLTSILLQSVFATPVDQIIVFGDSLSDNGNVYSVTQTLHNRVSSRIPIIPKNPPYYEGRFTNGPNWVENVSLALNTPLYDYAYGGAWTESVIDSGQVLPFGLGTQVNFYLASAITDFHKDKHLFVIWSGANDYVQGRDDPEYATTNTIATIQNQIEWLVYYGAKYILVLNLPDLSVVPLVIEKKATEGHDYPEKIGKMVQLHNNKLKDMIKIEQDKYPEVKFISVDIYTYFKDVLKDPVKYNIQNTSDPCYDGPYWLAGLRGLATNQDMLVLRNEANIDLMKNASLRTAYLTSQMAASGTGRICKNPDRYLYWDHLHPTSYVHEIISVLALSLLSDAGIEGNTVK